MHLGNPKVHTLLVEAKGFFSEKLATSKLVSYVSNRRSAIITREDSFHDADGFNDKLDDGGWVLHCFDHGDVGWVEGVQGVDGRLQGRNGLGQVILAVVTNGLGRGCSLVGQSLVTRNNLFLRLHLISKQPCNLY